jgi:hypothetical protein
MAEQRSDDQSNIDLKGPGGIGVAFRGSNQLLMVVILILVITGALGFYLQQHEVAAAGREIEAIKRDGQTQQILKSLIETVKSQDKNQEAMIFVLTLDDKERKNLRLNKPERLREMQR